jgi:hypothetical protein
MIQAYVLGFFCILHMLDNVHWIKISKSHTHIHTRMIHPLGTDLREQKNVQQEVELLSPTTRKSQMYDGLGTPGVLFVF